MANRQFAYATERVTENSIRHVKRLTAELQNKREALNDQRREYRALLSKRNRTIEGLQAERDAAIKIIESHTCGENVELAYRRAIEAQRERDAALAAIERVKHLLAPMRNRLEEYGETPLRHAVGKTLEILAALDGAPEPEVEELPETGLEMRDSDGDLIMSGEHRKVLHQEMHVCDSCVNDLGLNVRWDRAGFMEGHPFPVEGEKP